MKIKLYKFHSSEPRFSESFEIADTVDCSDDTAFLDALRPEVERAFGGPVRIDLWISPIAIYQKVPGSNPSTTVQVGFLE